MIIGAVLSMAASAKVNSTFSKYSKVRSMTGMTGEDAAKRLFKLPGHLRCNRPSGKGTADRPL